MSNNNKKLTSSILLQEQSKLFVQRKVIININKKDYDVLVDQVFLPTKLNKLIMESVSNYEKIKELDESVKISYLMFLAIKQFTNLDFSKTDDFKTQISILNAMLDLEIFDKIVSEFPESELEKINEYMLKFNDRIDEFLKDGKSIEYLKEVFGEIGLVDGEGEVVDDNVIDVIAIENKDEVTDIDEVNELVSKIEITDPE